ncbi:MAG: MAPEG family protein [Cupriavidus sp.]|nr:MAG: MAPEG family protein [Cupriavidus sp.]
MVAVLGFALWTLVLVFVSVNWRVLEVFRGKSINSWGRDDGIAVPALVKRMQHAHLNCLENLPIFAILVFSAYFMGKQAVVDGLACYVLYARLAQSLVHLIGTSAALVFVRATFYVIQVLIFLYMFWGLLA